MGPQEQRSIQVDIHNFHKQIPEASELIPKLQEDLESFRAEELLAKTAYDEIMCTVEEERKKHSMKSQEVASH